MAAKLIIASGKSAGRAISLKREKLLIGRADECDVRPLSEEVSRRHCAIHVDGVRVWAEDLKSRNGTYVNGTRIEGRAELADGDMVRIGCLELRVSCRQAADVSNATKNGNGKAVAEGGGEDDVSRWLMADDEPAGMFDTTQSMRVAEDVTVPLDTSAAAESPAGEEVTVVKSHTPVPKSSSSFVADASKKQSAENSRAAAAEALKKFFGNR